MEKENSKKSLSCRKAFIRHLRIFVSDGMINERKEIRRSRITNFLDDRPLCYNNAFTLIELLVVVLIIGILAAVALPQYEKAVWKSRTATMQTLIQSIATARNAYFLANGTNPTSFDELSLGFDSLATGATLAGAALDFRHNDLFEIRLYAESAGGYFVSGKYKGCGFHVDYQTGELRCHEWHYYYKGAAGEFCQKVMKAGELLDNVHNVRIYAI